MCCFVYPKHDSLYCSIWFVCVVLYIQNMNNCTVQSDLYVLICTSKTWFIVLFPLICMCCFVQNNTYKSNGTVQWIMFWIYKTTHTN
jgi:hypothetical protein